MKKLLGTLVIAIGAWMALGAPVRAQDPGPGRRGHVIVLPAQEIVGRRQLPASFLLARSAGRPVVVDLRTTFTGEIVRSVQHGPF